jgi:hypothetical protein
MFSHGDSKGEVMTKVMGDDSTMMMLSVTKTVTREILIIKSNCSHQIVLSTALSDRHYHSIWITGLL